MQDEGRPTHRLARWRRRLRLQGWRLWAVLAVLAYTLIGFLFLPWLARNQAPKLAQAQLGVDLSIEKIRFNPYLFRLSVEGLALEDPESGPMLAFRRLVVDFSLSSAWRRALDLRRADAGATGFAPAPRRRRPRQRPARARPPAAAGDAGGARAGRRAAAPRAPRRHARGGTPRHRGRGPPGKLVAGVRPAQLRHAGLRHAAGARGRLQPRGHRAAGRQDALERALRRGPARLVGQRRDGGHRAGALLGIRAPRIRRRAHRRCAPRSRLRLCSRHRRRRTGVPAAAGPGAGHGPGCRKAQLGRSAARPCRA
jgi:hypothetical protein